MELMDTGLTRLLFRPGATAQATTDGFPPIFDEHFKFSRQADFSRQASGCDKRNLYQFCKHQQVGFWRQIWLLADVSQNLVGQELVITFYRIRWRERRNVDAVILPKNPDYVVADVVQIRSQRKDTLA